MKKVKMILALLLAVCMSVMPLLVSAEGEPVLDGVHDQSVMAGTEFDALAGITATDAEGGDLTDMIIIDSTPALDFKNGKATPENPGDYELVYSVTDKNGVTAEDYATLTVTKKTGEEVVYKAFDFATVEVTDNRGWEARIGGEAQAEAALKNGAYVIDIKNPGAGDGDVQLAKAGYALKAADYRMKIWAKASKPTYAHILARNENAEGWETFGGAFNVRIEEKVAPLELSFSSPGEGSAELLFNLGKITPNPDNAEDTTPEDFTVTIENYPGDGGGVWSVKADIALPGVQIVQGEKYYYTFTVNAQNGQGGEVVLESAARGWEARANFNGLSASAGEDTVVAATFVAEATIDDPVIRLQIGNAPDGAAANSIAISNIAFGKMEGDKETKKTIEAFMPFGPNTANATNPAYPWQTFNGTDEDNERGVGTIWTADGSFFYRIDNGGTVDWHNKLICGFGGNPLTLASDSYYIVEITAKATKPVSCGVFLNPMGGWDPRFSEGMDLTEEFKTFRFATTDTFIMDMDFELLFQFGSEALSKLDEVTVEFSNVTIYQMSVL